MTNIETSLNELMGIDSVVTMGKRHKQIVSQKRHAASMNFLANIRAELEAEGKLQDFSVDAVLSRQNAEIYKDADLTPYVAPVVTE